MDTLLEAWRPWAQAGGIMAVAALAGLAAHVLVYGSLGALIRRVPAVGLFQGALLRRSRTPARLLFPLVAILLVLPLVAELIGARALALLRDVLYVLLTVSIAWLLIRAARAMEDAVLQRFDLAAEDNLQARKVVTQTRILRRILVVFIVVLALALVLMQYDGFRRIGTSILASAGIAGIIVGLAAQRTLGNLLAGFQIAITQPIRVEDVVIVEGEFGWVEEITLTYVVVRLWDLRRIVLPISYFIEQPFQNWTRTSAQMLGTVFLYLDYRVPVEDLRAEHRRLVEASDLWDGRACALQVTDASDHAVELRFLQSAASAPRLFDLRCHVREQLIAYVQQHHPEALPRTRAELRSEDGEDSGDEGPDAAQEALR